MSAKPSGTVPVQSRSPRDEGSENLSRNLESSAKLVLSENQWVLTRVSWLAVADLIRVISRAERIFVLGEGRSGLAVRMAAMRFMHLGRRVHVVGETTTPALGDGDTLIAVSGSGETPGVIMAVERARTAGGQIVAVTTTSSPLAITADLVILIPAPSKHDRSSTSSAQFAGSLFEQTTLLLFDTVFHALSRELGKTPEALWSEHANLE